MLWQGCATKRLIRGHCAQLLLAINNLTRPCARLNDFPTYGSGLQYTIYQGIVDSALRLQLLRGGVVYLECLAELAIGWSAMAR
jgi:hypothetical protein